MPIGKNLIQLHERVKVTEGVVFTLHTLWPLKVFLVGTQINDGN